MRQEKKRELNNTFHEENSEGTSLFQIKSYAFRICNIKDKVLYTVFRLRHFTEHQQNTNTD